MNEVVISPRNMEDFIWMSYRYCIGRHTIAACTHADTIAQLYFDNPSVLSEERLKFMALDIREEVTNQLSWKKGLHIEGNSFRKDIFSPLMLALNDYPEHSKKVFYFDADTDKIVEVKEDNSLYAFETLDTDYMDLIPWVRLSNLFDSDTHVHVTVEFNGETKVYHCYPWPLQYKQERETKYEIVYSTIDTLPCKGSHISSEYIKSIES